MNNHFNNLYESGGCISCRLTSALFLAASAEMHFLNKLGQIYDKMSRIGLFVIVVKQHMPWDGLNGGQTGCWRIRERGTS
jgi:hypothetical protein